MERTKLNLRPSFTIFITVDGVHVSLNDIFNQNPLCIPKYCPSACFHLVLYCVMQANKSFCTLFLGFHLNVVTFVGGKKSKVVMKERQPKTKKGSTLKKKSSHHVCLFFHAIIASRFPSSTSMRFIPGIHADVLKRAVQRQTGTQ